MDEIDMEGIEGIIDDTPSDIPVEEEDNTKEIISGLQDQITRLNDQLKTTSATKAERDEIVDRFSKAIGFIEGSGTGKYDPATGTILRVEPKQSGPDPIELLKNEIVSAEKELRKQYDDGELTASEYYDKLEKEVAPKKDQMRDMQFDRKLEKKLEELTPKQKQEEQLKKDSQSNNVSKVAEEYNKMSMEYPDIEDVNSDLFKKMNEIYLKKQNLYANANFDNGKGDPNQYRDLIERAVLELKAQGVDIDRQLKATRNKFAQPGNKGYKEEVVKESIIGKNELNMMVSQGITSKSLLSDINKSMVSWNETGTLVLKD